MAHACTRSGFAFGCFSYDTKLFEAAEATAVAREESEELRRQLTDVESQHQQALDMLHQRDLEVRGHCCALMQMFC